MGITSTNDSITKGASMNKHEIGDIVWLHGKGWDEHPLIVLDIVGDHDHVKVMSMRNDKYIWFFTPCQLHHRPKEQS